MKKTAKRVVEVAAWLLMAPLAYAVKWSAAMDTRHRFFQFGSQLVSLLPGLPGVLLRRAYYRTVLSLGRRNFTIDFATVLAQRGIEIGDNAYIGPFCNIGLSIIGRNVLIGSGVHIVSGSRVHNIDRLDLPIKDQGGYLRQVIIGNGAWLGNGCIVMSDIGDHVVVGAGSVVTRHCNDYGVYAGNPARKLRDRRGAIVATNGPGSTGAPRDSNARADAYTEPQKHSGGPATT